MTIARGAIRSGLGMHGLTIAMLAGALSAQSRRLNAPLLPEIAGDIHEFVLSPDGTRVVYRADQDTRGVLELWGVPLDGSAAPVKLSGALVAGGNVGDFLSGTAPFQVSPDGARVVYVADQLVDETFELFSALADGSGAPVKLSGTLVSGGDVTGSRISPDGARVVFLADKTTNGVAELYSAPLDGHAPAVRLGARSSDAYEISADSSWVVALDGAHLFSVPIDASAPRARLDAPLHASGFVESFQLAPPGGLVVFRADDDVNERYELYAAPLDGSAAPVKLNGPLIAAGDVTDYAISPDGERVVYLADQDTDHVPELYSVPLVRHKHRWFAGGRVAKLSAAPGPGGYVTADFELTLDSTRVVYRAYQGTGTTVELYARRIDGRGAPVKVNGPLVADGEVWSLRVSPDGAHVVYRAKQDSSGAFDLYSASLDGSGSVRLNDPMAPDDELVDDYDVTPDGQHVVYVRTLGDPKSGYSLRDLLSVPIDRSQAPVPITTNAPGDLVSVYRFAPDSARVVYRVLHFQTTNTPYELYSAPLAAGPPPVKLHPSLAAGDVLRDVANFQWSPDGRAVVYLADQDVDEVPELFVARSDGRSPPLKLNDPLGLGEHVHANFRVAPGGTRVVFEVSSTSGSGDLFSVAIDGSASPIPLHPPLGPGRYVYQFVISPDGARVVYVADQDTNDVRELYSVPIDGTAASVKLSGAISPGGGVEAFGNLQITPDGQRAVYVAALDSAGVQELFSARIDGSALPVKLSQTMPTGGDVTSSGLGDAFRVSPLGDRVVYRGDQITDEVYELFSVRSDGTLFVKLSRTMVLDGDVTSSTYPGDFQISSTGARVVFRADKDVDEVFELFSIRIEGNALPVKLSGTMTAGGDVIAGIGASQSAFRLSPDGTRVVYRADKDVDERFELYGVPINGGTAPVKLSGTLVGGGNVAGAQGLAGPAVMDVDPLGTRVVYVADASTNDRFELYGAPLDGSAAPVKLSGPLGAGDVMSFQCAPDGAWLAFRSDRDVDDVFELFRAPLDGSVAPRKVNPDLAGGRDVTPLFTSSPDSTRMVYLADQALDEVLELWVGKIERAPAQVPKPERP